MKTTFKYDTGKAVREMARERIGQPPSRRVELAKIYRKPKHKRRPEEE
jgi:hypothetical protein